MTSSISLMSRWEYQRHIAQTVPNTLSIRVIPIRDTMTTKTSLIPSLSACLLTNSTHISSGTEVRAGIFPNAHEEQIPKTQSVPFGDHQCHLVYIGWRPYFTFAVPFDLYRWFPLIGRHRCCQCMHRQAICPK